MKKMLFVVVIVLALLMVSCGVKPVSEQEYNAICWELGGLVSSEGCIMPEPECKWDEFCPICGDPVVQPQPAAILPSAPVVENTSWCQAVIVGIPVKEDGSCTFCTINYIYDPKGQNPGDVFVVKDTPMEYTAGAYVYQYQEPRFLECIAAQPFVSDPGYKPVYK